MGFFNMLLTPRHDIQAAPAFQVLVFGPAVARMSIAGKGLDAELTALAGAVEALGFPQGFSSDRVHATRSEVMRLIRIHGIAGFTDRLKTELNDREKRDAMRLALVAVIRAPQGDAGDIGILCGMAENIGMSRQEFRALHDACKAFGRSGSGPA